MRDRSSTRIPCNAVLDMDFVWLFDDSEYHRAEGVKFTEVCCFRLGKPEKKQSCLCFFFYYYLYLFYFYLFYLYLFLGINLYVDLLLFLKLGIRGFNLVIH